ncbi:Salicylate hydroxylase [Rasamsonia emersonii CBS 393.64]|uniref:Salicylate hydroxylase n=1 Tax=Rasamsonia emersonii (strain ATCC 16479 / CBS 393.64 / IMI 116815) TaxID=1408163 RepID=A0A0F4YFZ0_RASE3|nr:Salicylate hydroxylase [Rasamsonia emersonii CBS 393.64]KKA16548.1 Salicylate hydroxylase [Rasamsonia emersonii CBS 393.64]
MARESDREDAEKEFAPLVKEIVTFSKDIKQYALFAGPRLHQITAFGSVALVGDASHLIIHVEKHRLKVVIAGAGAGFALEDVYVLGQALKWAHENGLDIAAALDLVDRVRSPHYKKLYDILDEFAATDAYIRSHSPPLSFDEAVAILARETWSKRHHWIYNYDIQQVWEDAVAAEKRLRSPAGSEKRSKL